MRLKRHRHGFASVLSRPPHNFAEHARMRPMHSVKIPYADQRRSEVRWNVFEFMENLHGSGRWSLVSGQWSEASVRRVSLDTDHWPLTTELRFQTPALARHTTGAHAEAERHSLLHAPDRGKCA